MRKMITKTSKGRDAKRTVKEQLSEWEVVYATQLPSGLYEYDGHDVCAGHSVAVRFEPTSGHYLMKIGLWFIKLTVPGALEVSVTLRNDKTKGKVSIPGNRVLERFQFKISEFNKLVLEELISQVNPYLRAATKYILGCCPVKRVGGGGRHVGVRWGLRRSRYRGVVECQVPW